MSFVTCLISTPPGATNDVNVINLTSFPFQYWVSTDFIHIVQDYPRNGATLLLVLYQWSNPEGYGTIYRMNYRGCCWGYNLNCWICLLVSFVLQAAICVHLLLIRHNDNSRHGHRILGWWPVDGILSVLWNCTAIRRGFSLKTALPLVLRVWDRVRSQ